MTFYFEVYYLLLIDTGEYNGKYVVIFTMSYFPRSEFSIVTNWPINQLRELVGSFTQDQSYVALNF